MLARADAEPLVEPTEGVGEVRGDPRPRRTERVAEGDRPPVHVDLLVKQSELFLNGEKLGSERFVHVEQIEVSDGEPGALERIANRWRGADAHERRLDTSLEQRDLLPLLHLHRSDLVGEAAALSCLRPGLLRAARTRRRRLV